jgi:hypothetical protein
VASNARLFHLDETQCLEIAALKMMDEPIERLNVGFV